MNFNMWKQFTNKLKNGNSSKGAFSAINSKVIVDSITKLNPYYLAKFSPVMFTVEVGFFVVLSIALFPSVSSEFVATKPNILF